MNRFMFSGFHQGRESKAELIVIKNGFIVGIRILQVAGMEPLKGNIACGFASC